MSLRVSLPLRPHVLATVGVLPALLVAIACGGEGFPSNPTSGGNGSVATGGSSSPGSGGQIDSGHSGGRAANGGSISSSQGGALPGSGGSTGSGGTSTIGSGGGNTTGSGGANTTGSGGFSATGGKSAGGSSNGGSSNGKGGSANTGGAGRGGNASGGSASGGNQGTGGAGNGGATSTNGVFSQCRFHFGTIDSKAKNGGSALISQLDFFTPGWMLGDTFDQSYVCNDTKSGGALANLVPVVVTYIAAAHVKRRSNLCDCNVNSCGANNDLCHQGAQQILQNLTAITNAYRSYSQGYASCYGTTRPIIFAMEPDWYQYTGSSQTQPWTPAQAGMIMGQLVAALKSSLPNARFSMDVSPWVAPNNGGDHGAQWFSNFDMSQFTFVSTSGGGTNANTAKIRSSNNMTWAGLSQVSGKPILADTGYGANGSSAGHDALWDSAMNINSRIADGVVSINQYNPNSNWSSTISNVRGQLSMPKFCQ